MYQLDPLPEDFTEETGERTLALFEIMVRAPWRGTGVAHRIHEELLSERREERVTLLVDPTHAGVKRLYESWGYVRIGDQKPFPDSPLYATMVRELRKR
jgi:GNAT superfamily N-acetyltransferase